MAKATDVWRKAKYEPKRGTQAPGQQNVRFIYWKPAEPLYSSYSTPVEIDNTYLSVHSPHVFHSEIAGMPIRWAKSSPNSPRVLPIGPIKDNFPVRFSGCGLVSGSAVQGRNIGEGS
jgi:hypothetical protein